MRAHPQGSTLCRAPRPPLGLFVQAFASAATFPVLAGTGLDFAVLDMEHTGFTFAHVSEAVQGARATALTALVRVPTLSRSAIGRALDVGADGVIVPRVESAAQAAEIVRYARYAPLGDRNVAFAIGHDAYGSGGEWTDVAAAANTGVACIPLVETAAGVEAIEEICATPGIDAVWIGPADLSQSLGALGDVESAAYLAAEARVREACRAAGLPLGIVARSVPEARHRIEEGYGLIAFGSEIGILREAVAGLTAAVACGTEASVR